MLLRTPGKIEDQLIALGKFEKHVSDIMPHFAVPGTYFLDVGANIGFHSLNVASHCPSISVYCFEPNPCIREELKRNIVLNKYQDQVSVEAIALSDQKGEFDFYIMPDGEENRGMSSLVKEAVNSQFIRIKVSAEIFDDYWRARDGEKKRVSLVKVDTQGNEESVLRGMLAMISRDRPTLFLELETHLTKDKNKLWDFYCLLEKEYHYTFFVIDKTGFGLAPICFHTQSCRDYSVDLLGMAKS